MHILDRDAGDGSDASIGEDGDSLSDKFIHDSDNGNEVTDENSSDDGSDYAGDNKDGGSKPDFDPSTEFLLNISPGTMLCTTFSEGKTWQMEVATIGLIDIRPGYYVLPRQEGFYAADFIKEVLFGPEKETVAPLPGDGEFEAYIEIIHLWRCGIHSDEIQVFSLCESRSSYPPRTVTATTEHADSVEFTVRECSEDCLCSGSTSCLFLESAAIFVSGQTRTINEHFDLIYTAAHHNWYEKYFVWLDPPIENIAALLALAPTGPDYDGAMVLLDSNLDELNRSEFTSWEQDPW